jgi:hypothetical protein
MGDCVGRAISGPLNAITAVVWYGVTAFIVTRVFEVFRADATAPTVGFGPEKRRSVDESPGPGRPETPRAAAWTLRFASLHGG